MSLLFKLTVILHSLIFWWDIHKNGTREKNIKIKIDPF